MKPFFLLFTVLLSSVYISAQNTDTTTITKIGDPMPHFNFELTQEKQSSIQDYKGKVILINLFATWCSPCAKELPEVQKNIWEKYQNNKNFALFVFGRDEGWDKLIPYKQRFGYTFPILPDVDKKIYSLFATQYIPRNILIDKSGKIIYQSIGYDETEFKRLLKLIEKSIKE
ncbi:MAG: TlpA family protein disulfide reductase [Bacteroidia bacterium]|nr:MAG: TlpA family protein disulfide reductase [Bacteroidia bacterium]